MTKDQKDQALTCLAHIEPAIPPGQVLARVSCQALRELLTGSHGAADHGKKPERKKTAPGEGSTADPVRYRANRGAEEARHEPA